MSIQKIFINESGRQVIIINDLPTKGLSPASSYKFGIQKIVFKGGSELAPVKNKYAKWKFISSVGKEILLPSKWKIVFDGIDSIFIASTPYKGFSWGEWALVYPDGIRAYRSDQWLYASFKRKILNKKKWAKHQRKRYSASERDDDSDDEDNIMRGLGAGNGDLLGF